MLTRAFSIVKCCKGESLFSRKKNIKFLSFRFKYYKSMPNIQICLNEVQKLEQSHQIRKNSKFQIFRLPPLHISVKHQVKIILAVKFFIYEPIFKKKKKMALFTTFGMQKMTISYLYEDV